MQQQHYHQQQVVMLTQQSPTSVDNSFKGASSGHMFRLSVTQIMMGCLCIIIGITLIPLDASSQGSDISALGYGIWIGLIFIVLGVLGVRASKSKGSSACLTTTTLVLNIIFSMIGTGTFLSLTSIALIFTSINECHEESYLARRYVDGTYEYNWYTYEYDYVSGHYEYYTDYKSICNEGGISSVFYALDSLLVVMALTEFVVTIASAALCCGALCRCCKYNSIGVTMTGQFAATPHQVMIQPSQTAYPMTTFNTQYAAYPSGYQTTYTGGAYAGPPTANGWNTTNQYPPTYGVCQPAPVHSNQQTAGPSAHPHMHSTGIPSNHAHSGAFTANQSNILPPIEGSTDYSNASAFKPPQESKSTPPPDYSSLL